MVLLIDHKRNASASKCRNLELHLKIPDRNTNPSKDENELFFVL